MHAHRSEHWVIVSGEALVTNGERVYPVQVNESTFIPLKTPAPAEEPPARNRW